MLLEIKPKASIMSQYHEVSSQWNSSIHSQVWWSVIASVYYRFKLFPSTANGKAGQAGPWWQSSTGCKPVTSISISKYQYQNTNIKIPRSKYQDQNTSKYQYQKTNIKIPISKYQYQNINIKFDQEVESGSLSSLPMLATLYLDGNRVRLVMMMMMEPKGTKSKVN